MSDQVQQTEQRTCRFPGCERSAVSADAGTGPPPEYCDDDGHNRAAWRARRRIGTEPTHNVEDAKRHVDVARQRAGELCGQVAEVLQRGEWLMPGNAVRSALVSTSSDIARRMP